jgi:hypothetical protein
VVNGKKKQWQLMKALFKWKNGYQDCFEIDGSPLLSLFKRFAFFKDTLKIVVFELIRYADHSFEYREKE